MNKDTIFYKTFFVILMIFVGFIVNIFISATLSRYFQLQNPLDRLFAYIILMILWLILSLYVSKFIHEKKDLDLEPTKEQVRNYHWISVIWINAIIISIFAVFFFGGTVKTIAFYVYFLGLILFSIPFIYFGGVLKISMQPALLYPLQYLKPDAYPKYIKNRKRIVFVQNIIATIILIAMVYVEPKILNLGTLAKAVAIYFIGNYIYYRYTIKPTNEILKRANLEI